MRHFLQIELGIRFGVQVYCAVEAAVVLKTTQARPMFMSLEGNLHYFRKVCVADLVRSVFHSANIGPEDDPPGAEGNISFAGGLSTCWWCLERGRRRRYGVVSPFFMLSNFWLHASRIKKALLDASRF